MTEDTVRDDSGNIVDPPVIPEFEQRMAAAANSGDDSAVAAVQAEYDKAREDAVSNSGEQNDTVTESVSENDPVTESPQETENQQGDSGTTEVQG